MTLEDWLDDLGVRFLINLPQEDLRDIARFCFQIEEAQWFYEDFIRPLDPTLPSMSLKSFSLKMFQHCPLFSAFSPDEHLRAFQQFMEYKTRVPVRGAILLNSTMDSAVLVRGYKKGASWSFPRGKINKDEPDLDCAVREVYEETGYDLREAGLVERNSPVDYVEVSLKDQQVRLFIFRDVPHDTVFEPKTRKEIGDIKWYKLADLPAYRKRKVASKGQGNGANSNDKFYMVAPFMVQLRQWILKQRKLDPRTAGNGSKARRSVALEEELTEDNLVVNPVEVPVAPTTSSDYVDKATKELRDALLGPRSTNRPEDARSALHSDAGQDILGLLRNPGVPETHPARATTEQGRGADFSRPPEALPKNPFTPLEHISMEAPQPHAPHHHHPTQRLPFAAYDRPPPFPIAPNVNTVYSQHRQSRPGIEMTTDMRGQPTIQVATRYYQDKPMQLAHPQPLPPQVQGDKLIQSMMTSMVPDPNIRATPAEAQRNNGNLAQARHDEGRGAQDTVPAPHQLPAHSMSLLNALKGNTSGRTHNATRTPTSAQYNVTPTSTQYPRTFFSGSANQAELEARSGGSNKLPLDKAQFSPKNSSASPSVGQPNAADKHRSALLEMFKKGEASVAKSQLDGQSADTPSPRSRKREEAQKRDQQPPSTAEVLWVAARGKTGPLEMNPETNLPFGALSILPRPQSGKMSAERRGSPAQGADANVPHRRTPTGPLATAPPRYSHMQSNTSDARGQRASQPSLAQSYPYGPTQATAPNPMSMMLPSPPAASSFPVPGVLKPRQDSTSEHKNTLLSLFGKQHKTGTEKGREKEPTAAETSGDGTAPLSGLAPVAASKGDGPGGLADNPASRRGSQTPLSSADRNFLLGFLESKARQ
ncbi:hypothetical protein DL766_000734 [Monosporascus sp. MC13-8B]|uniref:Nudix hydrolase domain-containing protein n=1 Tax=Monosporascus cannonballus TaxID=155416 RepID=A0ABY0H9E4_9PEZI|nr:hypothetical protein DL762_004017 [Monosporascus cannonballus]RYO97775.1 hypothetical protein DL763_002571 [Monosporascus cannonballus]RYP38925.1 hypothetical protein DL766_000734 [Monosporascus sp. MC13-8B]